MIGGKSYFVYILASANNAVLYVGVTHSLLNRVNSHKERLIKGFTARYFVTKLVYYEVYGDPVTAIYREKQLKRWKREWKNNIITKFNSEWRDLYSDILNIY